MSVKSITISGESQYGFTAYAKSPEGGRGGDMGGGGGGDYRYR